MDVAELPDNLKNSTVLTNKHLQQLSSASQLPTIDPSFEDERLKNIFQYFSLTPDEMEHEIHLYAKQLLQQDKIQEAWQVLLAVT